VQCMFLHLAWSSKRLGEKSGDGEDGGEGDNSETNEAFREKCNKATAILSKLAISPKSRAKDAVKRQVSSCSLWPPWMLTCYN
jgi:hypothetical protein